MLDVERIVVQVKLVMRRLRTLSDVQFTLKIRYTRHFAMTQVQIETLRGSEQKKRLYGTFTLP
jgi:hypothetical protein